jgi:hypothetical protein
MSKVFSANAVWVDGYTSGRTPDGGEEFGRSLGDWPMLVDSYIDGIMHLRLLEEQLELFLGGLHAVALDASEPLRRQRLTLDELDRYLEMAE